MDNNNIKRVLMAVVLSLGVLFVWNYVFPPQAPVQKAPQTAQESQSQSGQEPAEKPSQAETFIDDETPELTSESYRAVGKDVTVSTPLYNAVFNTQGAVLLELELKEYKKTIKPGSKDINLINEKAVSKAPLGLLLNNRGTWREKNWSVSGADQVISKGETGELIFTAQIKGLTVERHFRFNGENYLIEETVRVINNGRESARTSIGFTLAASKLNEEASRYNMQRISYFDAEGKHEEDDAEDLEEEGVEARGNVEWGGIENNYFLMAAAPEAGDSGEVIVKGTVEDEVYRTALVVNTSTPMQGEKIDIACNYYFGPKKRSIMEGLPNNLERAIDLGWFNIIAQPLITALNFFYDYTGNYGLAVIILTVVIKILFAPLSYKSYQSMNKMKKIQPLMMKVREKYKEDKQRQQQEMMKLYKTYKVNPAGGCLPMLLQIPVFIGLYQGLLYSIELRHASFITHLPFTDLIWLADLSAKDPFYITPIVMGATMFLQQKLTPAAMDPTQAKIMMLMPLFITFIGLNFPSGLVLYWMMNNLISIAQQWWMLRKS